MNIFETEGLTKTYRAPFFGRETTALADLTLSAPEGGIFGLLGPNGSGKTTCIKLLLGLIRPTRGTALVLSQPPGANAALRQLGYLPEESRHHGFLTARESLHFFGQLHGMGARERKERASGLLERVGLTEAADRKVGGFSKGMGRRLGLAQALMARPRLLVLDEPTSGLDPVGTHEVQLLIRDLSEHEGTTTLLTSHLLSEIELVCDRIAVLHRGKLMREGTVTELLELRGRRVIQVDGLEADVLARLLRQVEESGARVVGVETPKIPLEKFFLELIEGSGGDPEARSDPLGPAGGPPGA